MRSSALSTLIVLSVAANLTGCMGVWKAAPDFNRISVGMTKQEVVEKLDAQLTSPHLKAGNC